MLGCQDQWVSNAFHRWSLQCRETHPISAADNIWSFTQTADCLGTMLSCFAPNYKSSPRRKYCVAWWDHMAGMPFRAKPWTRDEFCLASVLLQKPHNQNSCIGYPGEGEHMVAGYPNDQHNGENAQHGDTFLLSGLCLLLQAAVLMCTAWRAEEGTSQ